MAITERKIISRVGSTSSWHWYLLGFIDYIDAAVFIEISTVQYRYQAHHGISKFTELSIYFGNTAQHYCIARQLIVVFKASSFYFVDRQVVAELLSVYANLGGTCESIVMIKGEYFTSNCIFGTRLILLQLIGTESNLLCICHLKIFSLEPNTRLYTDGRMEGLILLDAFFFTLCYGIIQ